MKINVNRDDILEGLQRVQSIVSPKATLPILSNILLKTKGDTLTLTATDLEVSIQTSIKVKSSKDGGSTLPAKRIYSVFRELANHEIELSVDDKNHASIKCGPSFFKLVGMDEDEFPSFPKIDSTNSYNIDQAIFKDMLKKVSYAVSTDETKYVLNGVLLSFKGDKLIIVATDGRRLAMVEQELEFPKSGEGDFIVPAKTINELVRTLGDEGSLKINTTENQIAFDFDEILLVSKLIEGSYPNYKQVIPAQFEERITIEREALLTATRRAALVASEHSNSVKLKFTKNKLEIISNTPEIGESKESLPIKYSGKEISIAFNPTYLMDPLKVLPDDEIYFEASDDLSPGVIKASIPFLYVLMPMRMA